MYFVYSKDDFLLREEINKIIDNFNFENLEVDSFSFIDDPLINIVNSLSTFPFFSDKKIVILKDCWFVTDLKLSLHKSFNLEKLTSILNKGINKDIEIIFCLNSDQFSKKNKTAEWFKKNTKLKFINSLNEDSRKEFIKQNFLKLNRKINAEAIEYLVNNLPNNMELINKEIQKLLFLNKNIELSDVKNNLTKYFENDVFELSNYFLTKNVKKFLKLYQDYKIMNNDIFPLIALLANNLSILRNALIIKKQNITEEQIAQKLGINSYRLKILLKVNKSTINELNDRIIMLYNLNKNLVLGKIDSHIIPEYEFIKILK